jgi:limonene-1,2-epoxide hydrolase
MADTVALALAFVDRWNQRDIDGIIVALAEDIDYQNVPMAAMHGRAEVRAFITPNLIRATRIEWIVHNLAVTADRFKVLTERTDNFHFEGGVVSVPVMGVFEFRDGLIARWRDYADIGDFVRQMGAINQKPGWNVKDAAGG